MTGERQQLPQSPVDVANSNGSDSSSSPLVNILHPISGEIPARSPASDEAVGENLMTLEKHF